MAIKLAYRLHQNNDVAASFHFINIAEQGGAIPSEVRMLKPIIIVCAICAGSAAFLVKLEASPEQKPPAAVSSLPSFQEMHANAHLENLPVIIDKERN
jgi:hypothetical protein